MEEDEARGEVSRGRFECPEVESSPGETDRRRRVPVCMDQNDSWIYENHAAVEDRARSFSQIGSCSMNNVDKDKR